MQHSAVHRCACSTLRVPKQVAASSDSRALTVVLDLIKRSCCFENECTAVWKSVVKLLGVSEV